MRLRAIFLAVAASLAVGASAVAQTSPGLVTGQVPTETQWNGYFSSKLDYNPSGCPISSGCTGATTITGAVTNLGLRPLGTVGATIPLNNTANVWGAKQTWLTAGTGSSSVNCPAGTQPLTAIQGDVYCDAFHMWGFFNGAWQQFSLGGDTGAGLTFGRLKTYVATQNANNQYAAGTCTHTSNAFTCSDGVQPQPATLAAGQVYFVNFPAANTGAATLQVGSLPQIALKVTNSAGAVLSMTGGEIVAGPATVYYDGTEGIYASAAGAQVEPITGARLLTQADFSANNLFYLTGAETFTLPCSNTLSANGRIQVFSVSGSATIQVGGSCSPDTVEKNGSTGSSTTVAAGAAAAYVVTDGAGHFYVSGS